LGAIGVVGRWHFLRREGWSVFFDGGGSVVYADQEFPQGGTNFNLVGKLGFGVTYQMSHGTHLIGGFRYFHLSNGQIRKQDDNPNYNGMQWWGGVMWTF
jgi:hypothetical protein